MEKKRSGYLGIHKKNIKGNWAEDRIEENHSTAGKNKKEIENENENARQFPVSNDGGEDRRWRGQLSRRRGYYISSCSAEVAHSIFRGPIAIEQASQFQPAPGG